MNVKDEDIFFMSRALELAKKGYGRVSPNPLVGAVIVKNHKIIAEGFHKKFGGNHAEVDALKKLSFNAKGSTLYVNLEPCHHHGKTPPCVDAVIRAGCKRVVIAHQDPNPKTKGKSIRKLKAAGIEVTVGVLKKEAEYLNRFFISHIVRKRPYVIVKIAQTLDSKIAEAKGKRTQITGKESLEYVQNLRSSVDAVLVGRKTIQIDDPKLNVRNKKLPQPKRVILDRQLKISPESQIFKTHGGPVIIYSTMSISSKNACALRQRGAEILCVAQKKQKIVPLDFVLSSLHDKSVASILVEGGSEIFSSFYQSGLVDEWVFLAAPITLGVDGVNAFQDSLRTNFVVQSVDLIGPDLKIRAKQKS